MSREIRSFAYGREYIPTGLAESSTCRLLIVTDDQIEILRSLVNYAHQRRSWNDETIDDARYYLPSDEDWDDIEALVSDLEYQLMAGLDPVDGDLIIGNVTPEWSKLAVSIPSADLINVLAVAHADLRPSWKTASSNPGAAVAVLASNASGYLQLAGLGIGGAPTALLPLNMSANKTTLGSEEIRLINATSYIVVDGASALIYGDYLSIVQNGGTTGANVICGTRGAAENSTVRTATYVIGGDYLAKASGASGGGASYLYGWRAIALASGGNSAAPIGCRMYAQRSSTLTADAYGIVARVQAVSTGKITNGYGMLIEAATKDAGATFVNTYGLVIQDQNVGSGLNYSLYTGAGDVRLGGKFGCNAATPQAAASVTADATDLPTAIALLNQLRALLIANGQAV